MPKALPDRKIFTVLTTKKSKAISQYTIHFKKGRSSNHLHLLLGELVIHMSADFNQRHGEKKKKKKKIIAIFYNC